MNVLDFEQVRVALQEPVAKDIVAWEFLIDGSSLASHLSIERENLAYISSTLDAPDDLSLTQYADELLGLATPSNQFGTNRVVLYRCHCGCDYCGVISAEVKREADNIVWHEVGWETDGDVDNGKNRSSFSFSLPSYETAISSFLKRRTNGPAQNARGV